MRFLLSLLVLSFSGLFSVLIAQQQSQQAGSLLPDINPQDIEIRGDFQARFVGLSRQPILGFDPRPRVFQIDPNRMPFIESADEVLATVSITDLERPISPDYDPIHIPRQNHTFARMGFGMFSSPFADVQHESRLSDNAILLADAHFHSSAGHMDDENTAFRRSALQLSYNIFGDNSKFSAFAGFESGFNYHARDLVNSTDTQFKSEIYSLNSGISYQKNYNAFSAFRFSLDYRLFSLEQEVNPVPSSTPYQEHVFGYNLSRTITGSHIDEIWSISLQGHSGIFSNTSRLENDGSWTVNQFNLGYERRIFPELKAKLMADASFANGYENQFLFRPGLKLSFAGLDDTEIRAGANLFTDDPSAYRQFQYNPLLVSTGSMTPEMGFEAYFQLGYELTSNLKVYADTRYRWYENYLSPVAHFAFIDNAEIPLYENVTLSNVQSWVNSAGVSYDFVPGRFSASLDASIKTVNLNSDSEIISGNTRLDDNNANTPGFYDPLAFSLNIFTNPLRNLYITTWADYKAGREAMQFDRIANPSTMPLVDPITYNLENNENLKSDNVFLVNIQVDYRVSPNFGLYLRGLNMLDQQYEYWRGYQERPLQIYGGFTLTF